MRKKAVGSCRSAALERRCSPGTDAAQPRHSGKTSSPGLSICREAGSEKRCPGVSMIEHELLAVEQCPEEVFRGMLAVRTGGERPDAGAAFLERGEAGKRG